MNTITNRQAICDALRECAASDTSIVALFSDSRGSASMGDFIKEFPERVIEVGIAEQNLVGISAGLASCGMRPFAFSPACFLSARSYEQIKIDVAYSHTNVKLIGISGGASYGALGMSHHSVQDIAAISSIPNMRVYLPSDRHQTRSLIERLARDDEPTYVRIGRNAVEDVYGEEGFSGEMNEAFVLRDGSDVGIIACGETVRHALDAADELAKEGIDARVVDMYCLRPLDKEAVVETAKKTGRIVTVEEHVKTGGLGAMVAQALAETLPTQMRCLALPDEPLISGKSGEIFRHYGIDARGIAQACRELCGV